MATLALAALLEGQLKGNATTPTDINESYWKIHEMEDGGFRGADMAAVGFFDKGDAVWACVDESSTPKNPIVYVETIENGARSAYKYRNQQNRSL